MKLTLISTDGSTRLSVDTFPFTLGREALISSAAPDAAPDTMVHLMHISKKHAIFTCTEGSVYVNDAGSMNGTFHNGRKLTEQKAILCPGDLLSFAEKMDFMVDLSPCTCTEVSKPQEIRTRKQGTTHVLLDKTPFRCGINLEKLLEISSKTPFFAFTTDEEKVSIAPLSADHGAKINGIPLPYGHTLLPPGTIITTHSGDEFTVAETVGHTAENEQQQKKDSAEAKEDKTIYMSEATTFMNVFEKDVYTDENKAPGTAASGKATKQRTGAGHFFGGKTALRFIAFIILATLSIGGGFLWYRSTDSYKVQKLFDDKNFAQSLKTADRLLAENSNKKLAELGKKSLIHLLIPVFQDSLNDTGTKGYSFLDSYRSFSVNIPGAGEIIETLAFVARVKRFADLSKTRPSIDYEQWKNETIAINTQWSKSGTGYKTIIDEISQQEPALKETFETFFSDVNDCRENEIYSIKKVSELEERIRILLQKKDYPAASRLLKSFSSPHSDLLNTEKWADDLALYKAMEDAYEIADLFELDSIRNGYLPKSPLFSTIVKDFRQNNLPDPDVSMLLARAEEKWRTGAVKETLAILQQVQASPVQKKLEEKLAYLSDVSKYQALLHDLNGRSRCHAVAGLAEILEKEDTLLKKKYEQYFNSCRAKAEQLIPVHSRKATQAFKQFNDKGGISGKMRMEPKVTPAFKSQAALLAAALSESTYVKDLGRTFAIPVDANTETLFADIAREQKSQTARIAESVILPTAVIQEKLSLFEIQEVDEWLE